MGELKKYKKKATSLVTAVQLNLDTPGFTYQKWGGKQVCKQGDWLVDNEGDVYTVSRDSFAKTYMRKTEGRYFKPAPVWAEIVAEAGRVDTKEGSTAYQPGDYLVYNNEDKTDAYAMSPQKFESMYEPADDDS